MTALVEALDRLDEPTSVHGTAKVGPLEVVLPDGARCAVTDPGFVDWLLEHAEDAPFGDGGKTVVDPSVRRTKRLAARGRARLVGFDPPLARIAAKLAPRGTLRAKLTDILVYPVGGKFKKHKDTPRTKRLLGTLVVGLPVPHRGGAMTLDDGVERYALDWSDRVGDPQQLPWVALYGDVDHAIRVVERGHRVTAVYALEVDHDPRAPLDRFAEVAAALEGDRFVIPCSRHVIVPKDGPPTVEGLRGIDRDLVDLLEQRGLTVTLRPCIAAVPADDKINPSRMRRPDFIALLDRAIPPKFPWGGAIKVEGPSEISYDPDGEPLDVTSLEPYLAVDDGATWVVRKTAAATFEHEALFSESGYFGNEHYEALFYSLVALEASSTARPAAGPAAAPTSLRRVRHAKFGDGDVLAEHHDGSNTILEIRFDSGETKKLVERFVQPI